MIHRAVTGAGRIHPKEGERRPVENLRSKERRDPLRKNPGRKRMNKILIATTSIFGLLAVQGFPARADQDLDNRPKDPKQWVMQQGDNANTRYSKLNQINASNAKKLHVPCTFSTPWLHTPE